MSKVKLLTIAVIALLAINIGMVAFYVLQKSVTPATTSPSAKKEGPKKIIIERLHFDKDQVTAYESIIVEHQKAVKMLKDSISTTKNNLYQSLKTDNYTSKDSLIVLLGVLQKRIESVHYEHFLQIKKICTPQQIADFNMLTNELGTYFTTEKKVEAPKKY
jgi:periplasmic protein CpxP/Spy